MKLRSFITEFKTQRRKDAKAQRFFYKFFFASLRLCALALIFSSAIYAQKLAVLVPEKNVQVEKFAEKLEDSLAAKLKILNRSLSETAFNAENYANPFNLSTGESKIAGARLGCDYFLLIKAANQRRSTFAKADFFESYAAVYVVSARTGRLVFWKLNSFEDEKETKAEDKLLASTDELASEIFEKLKIVGKDELNENRSSNIEELPDENSTEAKNLRPPLPYKRIKPEYTRLASLYFVEATIDIEIEVGADGKILKTEIVRWAGFGLDESVTDTIRRMQWRAADRNGKPLPMRVLLRYNFKKPEKD